MNKWWALFSALVAGAVGVGMGCQRSTAYKQDQSYYREDSGYSGRKGGATLRAEAFGQPKKRVYVLSFMNATPLGGDELGDFTAQEFLRQLRSAGRAVVPEDLRSADVSKEFYSGDKIRLGALVREGRKLGVAFLIVGKVKKITFRTKGDDVGVFRSKKAVAAVDMEMRIFDIGNSREILFVQKGGESQASQLNIFGNEEDKDIRSQRDELIRMAVRNAVAQFSSDATRALEKMAWEGRIAKITGNQIFINAGRSTGLNIGDILKVLTVGEDVYDPVTGAYMGRSNGQPKGTLEVVDYLGTDGSVAAVHSGGNFVENDVVQLY